MDKFIAQRELLYSQKPNGPRRRLVVRISAPYALQEGMVDFKFDAGTAGCRIEFDGLPEKPVEVYGSDSLQAIELASNIDPYIKGLGKKYDFFWASGEPYFDDADS
jgi:hypothetical protein